MMDRKLLEIIIITYNRDKYLDYTMSKILNSSFKLFNITILDNCSTDSTAQVCNKYSNLYCNVKSIKHNKNIGGNANYLRAVEIATAEYVWIICDDDFYDFVDVDDVIGVISDSSSDLIFVGSWEKISGGGRFFSAKEYYVKYNKYFSISLFVPSVIFRVNKFRSDLIRKGYINARSLFPHFSFFLDCYNENVKLYISKKQIVYNGDDGIHGFSKLDLTISYLFLAGQIQGDRLRRRFLDEVVFHNENCVILLGRVAAAKSYYGDPLVYHVGESYFYKIFYLTLFSKLFCIKHKIYFLLSAFVSLFPRSLCKLVVSIFSKKIKEKYIDELPEIILKQKNERNQLREEACHHKDQIERMENL